MGLTKNKELAFRSIINVWLKDKTRYCCQCGKLEMDMVGGKCCDDQLIGNNWQVAEAIVEQNKDIRASRMNDFASNKEKNLRWGVSIPPSLFYTIDRWKRGQNLPGLFNEKGELEWFMRKFPAFKVANKV